MTLERITKDNLDYAVQIQEEIFPGESGRANFGEAIEGSFDGSYYLIVEGGACAGIMGIYSYPEDHGSAWLGWFGIREGFRRKHLGSEAMKIFEGMAEARGCKYARLYTDAEQNEAAISFYKANGYICEPYQNMEDPACLVYKTLIFSKPLTHTPLALWNSRNIHLTEQIDKQRMHGRGSG